MTDILGQPVLFEDARAEDDVPAIRDALIAPGQLSRTLFARSQQRETLVDSLQCGQLAEFAWANYQSGRVSPDLSP